MDASNFGKTNELQRETWIEEQIKKIPDGSVILDAGAGDQHHRKLCNKLNYVAQDFAGYDGIGNKAGLQTGAYNYGKLDIVSDIISIPKEDESYDAILCTEVLEHIPYPELAVKELSRLLAPGGRIILTAPFCSLTHFAPYHYMTGFNKYWYERILPIYDLKIISIETYGDYFEYLAQELNRLPYVAQQYVSALDSQMSIQERTALQTVMNMLARFGTHNHDAWQLLNFGFLVIAEKEHKWASLDTLKLMEALTPQTPSLVF